MQVRAKHDVDGLARETGFRQFVQERRVKHADFGLNTLLVVADARIDHDALAPGLDDERLEMQDDVARFGRIVRHQPIPPQQYLLTSCLQKIGRVERHGRQFEHPRDSRIADRPASEGFNRRYGVDH